MRPWYTMFCSWVTNQKVVLPLVVEVCKYIITSLSCILGYSCHSCKLLSHVCGRFVFMQCKAGDFWIFKRSKIGCRTNKIDNSVKLKKVPFYPSIHSQSLGLTKSNILQGAPGHIRMVEHVWFSAFITLNLQHAIR